MATYKTIKTTKIVIRGGKRVKVTTTKRVLVKGSTKKTVKKSSKIDDKKNGKYDAPGKPTAKPSTTTSKPAKTPVNRNARNPGRSTLNAPPVAKTSGFHAQGGRMVDGGPAMANANDNASFKRQMNFNLSNDEDLAQGSHHKWAQPTSISHLISGQLRQAANSPVDYFEQWAQDKTGIVNLSNRNGSPFGVDASFAAYDDDEDLQEVQSPSERLALNNPMGAFGTNAVMMDYGNVQYEEDDGQYSLDDGMFSGWGEYTGWYDENGKFVNAANGMTGDQYKERYGGFYLGLDDATRREWMAKDPNGYKKAMKDAKAAELKAVNEFAKKFPNSNNVMKDSGAHNAYNDALRKSFATYWNTNTKGGKMTPDGKGWEQTGNGGNAPYEPTKDEGYKPTPLPNYDTSGQPTPTDGSIFGETPSGVYNPWSRLEGGSTNSYGPNPNSLAQGQMEAMALANAYFAPQRAELAYELGDMETDMRRLAVNLGRQVDDPVLQAKLYKEASRAVRTLDIQQNTFAFQMAESRRKEDIANWQFYDQLAAQEAQLKLANRQFYEKLELDKRYYNLQNWNAQQNANMMQNIPKPDSQSQEDDSYGNLLSAYRK